MLTKSALQYIGTLIKSALPFAIVDSAPKNWFAGLVSYPKIANATGAGHKLIIAAQGTYYNDTCTTDNVVIIASRAAVWKTLGTSSGFVLSGDHCVVIGGATVSLEGGASGNQSAFENTGSYNTIIGHDARSSDVIGIHNNAGTYNTFIGNNVGTSAQQDIDEEGIQSISGANNVFLGNIVGTCGGHELHSWAVGTGFIGNLTPGSYRIEANGNILGVGNLYGSISDNKSSGTVANNETI